ncbi:DNA polymerase III subunit delta [Heliophilum fasciatum]|uniref:DNA polymerase III subunit delta n=1 Tax=Heliophilum fasciatum TaxID=35700 RepID=A0A4R2RK12_9FIRM|nr:DNA polymerase III subunit delta [Heliophilum fasciatum]MCW2278120.1 DNA polymerase-3 subunit delta [Heliophilum fasciatum]TCP64190.1 DNA polymerase III delta subunit [Heliophilum fasciatum]
MDYQGFKAALDRGLLAPVYILTGEDPFLLQELYGRLTAWFLAMPSGDFNFDRLEGDTSAEALTELAQTPPFLGERRLVVVRDLALLRSRGDSGAGAGDEEGAGAAVGAGKESPVASAATAPSAATSSGKRGKNKKAPDSDASLLAYVQDPNPTTTLVFYSPGGVDKRKRLYKAVEKAGGVVEVKALRDSDVLAWVRRRADGLGMPIDPEALTLLVERTGNDLGLLTQELTKLQTFLGQPSPQRRVTVERVRRLVPATAMDKIFAITEALGRRAVGEALTLTRELILHGEKPVPLMFLIVRHVRQLLMVTDLAARRVPKTEWVTVLKVPPGIVRKLEEQAKRFRPDDLRMLHGRFAEADRAVKKGREDAQALLERIMLSFARSQ